MKNWQTLLAVVVSVSVGAALVGGRDSLRAWAAPAAPAPAAVTTAAPADCDSTRTVSVTGAATVNVTPDRAQIKLGVQSNNRTPELVQSDNQAAIQRVLEAARTLGVADKDIRTDYYLVQPVYQDYDSLTIKGYRIDNVVAITLNDVSRTSAVLAASLRAGANQVLDVQFYTSQLRQYRDQARALAVTAAAEKAQALAQAGGAQTGCLMHIDENSWVYFTGHSWWGSRDSSLWTQNVVQSAPSDAAPPSDDGPVSLGQIAIQAEVNASYSLR